MKKIILASKSPRRKAMMADAGFEFETISADIDETINVELDLEEEIVRLAKEKVAAVKALTNDEKAIIVGADTLVEVGGEVLGKPENADMAKEMLKKLSGATHRVLTGVSIYNNGDFLEWCEVSKVKFKVLSNEEIEEYILTGECMDKAGAYGIQDKEDQFVVEIEGDYNSIVGMPISKVKRKLDKML